MYMFPTLPPSPIKPGFVLFQMFEVVCNLTSEFWIMDELLQFTLPKTVRVPPEMPSTVTSLDKI